MKTRYLVFAVLFYFVCFSPIVYSAEIEAILGDNAGVDAFVVKDSDTAIVSSINSNGDLTLNAQADLRFADSDSSNYVSFQSPATVSTNVTWTLPAADGLENQVLSTNGSGTLSWAAPASGDITAVGSMTSADAFAGAGADDDWLGLGASAGRIEFDDQSTDEVNILSANVGIGTSTPTGKLHIYSTYDVPGLKYTDPAHADGFMIWGNRSSGSIFNPYLEAVAAGSTGSCLEVRGLIASGNDSGTTPALRLVGAISSTYANPSTRPAITLGTYDNNYLTIMGSGKVGLGVAGPTAAFHIKAGTATANTAPLKFTSGTLLGTTEAGAVEYDGTHLYFTAENAGTRYQLDQQVSSGANTALSNLDSVAINTSLISDTDNTDDLGSLAKAWNNTYSNKVFTTVIAPHADGTTALQINKADGTTNVLNVDTTNSRLGIGTTSPGAKLDISSTGYDSVIFFSRPTIAARGTVGGLSTSDGAYAYLATNLYINNGGSLTFTNDAQPGWMLVSDARSGEDKLQIGRAPANEGGDPTLANFLTIDNAGKVGIGTTAPNTLLSLGGATAYISADSSDGSDNRIISVSGGGGYGSTRGSRIDVFGNEHASSAGKLFLKAGGVAGGDIEFYTANDALNIALRMIVKQSSGNVGIGTDAPGYSLHVNSAASADSSFAISDADVVHGMTDVAETAVYGKFAAISSTAGGLGIKALSDTDAQALSITGIIGSTNPTDATPAVRIVGAKKNTTSSQDLAAAETVFAVANNDDADALTVLGDGSMKVISTGSYELVPSDGTLTIDGGITADDVITFTGLGTGTGTDLVLNASNQVVKKSSSLRYKKDVTALDFDSSKILELKPVSFSWKSSGERDFGFIAEEVEKVLPQLVIKNKDAQPESVKYDQVAVLLLEQVKKQNDAIQELTQKVEQLSNENKILKTEIVNIQRR